MRTQLAEIKLNEEWRQGAQESHSKKAAADEPALAKSVDSQRYQGRQS